MIEIPLDKAGDISRISRAVSIDAIRNGKITAYANESELMTLIVALLCQATKPPQLLVPLLVSSRPV